MKKQYHIYHRYSDCDQEVVKSFLQIRPYYEGTERLMRIYYCTKCGAYEETDNIKDDDSLTDVGTNYGV